ncbi:hypothetical protein GCM10010201_25440 [Pilimelia columellifera subsp. columellifera]|uniref:Ricin B lectin domain-containing protein n=2 Tax=Pilimelia TaxID=53370 RepID=A0ABN3NLK0_9ACTN
MPVAMLLILVSVSLTTAALPTVVGQTVATRASVDRGHALHAARTGLDVALSHLRGTGGARASLPCGVADTAKAESLATFVTTIDYYLADPGDPNLNPPASKMTCEQARVTSPGTPRYAQLTAVGTTIGPKPVRRGLRGIYEFKLAPTPTPTATATAAPTSTPTVGPTYSPEGETQAHPRKIHSWAASSNSSVCFDAGSSSPAVGYQMKFRTCDFVATKDLAYKQFFYYRQNLSIATVGSIHAGNPLCLDAGANPGVGTIPTLQLCVSPVPARQRWYYNNTNNFELGTDAAAGLSGLCVNVANPGVSGSNMVLGGGTNCRNTTFNTRQTFGVSPYSGPGAAGSRPVDCTAEAGYPCDITQVFLHAGGMRCLDKYSTFMANMECVQHPDPLKARWNQLWRLPRAPDGVTGLNGPIYTVDPSGRNWCLTASSIYPAQVECNPKKPAANQRFTRYANTGQYDTMYRITDSSGRCMTHPTNYTGSDQSLVFIWSGAVYNYKIRLNTCVTQANDPYDKETYGQPSWVKTQKWNAPARLPTSLPGSPSPTPSTSSSPAAPSPSGASGSPAPGTVPALPLRDLEEFVVN